MRCGGGEAYSRANTMSRSNSPTIRGQSISEPVPLGCEPLRCFQILFSALRGNKMARVGWVLLLPSSDQLGSADPPQG